MLIIIGHVLFILYMAVRLFLIRGSKDDDNMSYYEVIKGQVLTELGSVYVVMLVITFVVTLMMF